MSLTLEQDISLIQLPLKVLEIGGGTGANFEFLVEPIHWTTIDPNEDMLECFKQKVKELQQKHDFGGVMKVKYLTQFPLFAHHSAYLIV